MLGGSMSCAVEGLRCFGLAVFVAPPADRPNIQGGLTAKSVQWLDHSVLQLLCLDDVC